MAQSSRTVVQSKEPVQHASRDNMLPAELTVLIVTRKSEATRPKQLCLLKFGPRLRARRPSALGAAATSCSTTLAIEGEARIE